MDRTSWKPKVFKATESVDYKVNEVNIERGNSSMKIDGKNVIKIWESMQGWYWYAVEDQGEYTGVGADGNDVQAHAWFGYVQADFNEWGTFDSKELERAGVWTVPKSNWGWTGRMEESKASEGLIDDLDDFQSNYDGKPKLNDWLEFVFQINNYDKKIYHKLEAEATQVWKKYTGESKASEVNGYIAYYDGHQTEIYADTSYNAQQKAIDFFNPPESKKHTVTVMIAEKDGEQVTHTFTESEDVMMYDGTDDDGGVRAWWDFELPLDEMKHEQLSSILGIDVNTAWGFMTPAEQERVKNYKLNRSMTNEAQLMKEINDGWEFSVIDHGYGGGNKIDGVGNSPDRGLLEVGIFSPDTDPVMGVQKSAVQGYMTQADVDGLLSTFRTDPAVAFRSIGGEWTFDGQKGLEYQSHYSDMSDITWRDIETMEGSLTLLERNMWLENRFDEITPEDFRRLADTARDD